MEKNFETEVLTRLAVIESKLDDYKPTKEKAEEAYTMSQDNKKRLDKVEDNNKWLFRTAVGAIITSGISLVYLIIKIGIGIN